LPGSELLTSLEEAESEAVRIGFPVMLKSSAGGGGIGMSLCRSASELASAYETVRRLSQNNFGDASVYLERFVERARHIEVQLFGDGRGDVIALGERDGVAGPAIAACAHAAGSEVVLSATECFV